MLFPIIDHLAKVFVYELSGCGFKSSCSHLNPEDPFYVWWTTSGAWFLVVTIHIISQIIMMNFSVNLAIYKRCNVTKFVAQKYFLIPLLQPH